MSNVLVERVTEITPEVLEAATRLTPQLESSNQVTIDEVYLQRIVDNPDNYWLMARRESDAKLIGMASLVIMPMPTNIRSSLENVVVDESARGEGAGTSLCEAAKSIADGQNVNTLRAAASKTNKASLRMLEKAGFTIDDSMHYQELSIHRGPRF